MMKHRMTQWAGMCASVALLLAINSCDFADDLLQVDNPEEIQTEALNDPALLEVQLNGVIDAFQDSYVNDYVQFGVYPTDEVLTGVNWEGTARANQRIINYIEGEPDRMFTGMSRSLRMGNDLAERIRVWAADDPATDFNTELATALAYAGYSAVVLAEHMCQAVISLDPDAPSGTILEQPDIFAAAIPYLTEAHDVASATGDNDIANLARTGLARAYLGQADWSNAATWGNQVTAGFQRWIEFVDIAGGRNGLEASSFGGNYRLGIHPSFTGTHPSFDGTGFAFEDDDVIAAQTDPRIQHLPTDGTGHNGLTRLYKLMQGLRYSDYSGNTIAPSDAACPACTGTDPSDMPLLADNDDDVLMADYLEAQHHYYEALAMQGGSDAAVLTFVNARRAVGNQAALTGVTGQALITELRNQRARDLFMGGFRLGDLRRWTRYDPGNGPHAGGEYFPQGNHPNAQWGAYGAWTCYPIPIEEYEGNPNLQKPTNPDVPPAI